MVEEAVICCDQDVGCIGVRPLLDQEQQLTERLVRSLEHGPLGRRLVSGRIDPVVVDVEDLVLLVRSRSSSPGIPRTAAALIA